MSTDTLTSAPTLAQIEADARRLIAEHLGDVPFEWDRAVRRAGACHFLRNRRTGETTLAKITLSRPIFSHSEEARRDALDTILHEIAHAIAGHAAGHGPAWRRVALGLGCTSERCHDLPVPSSGIIHWCSGGCEHDGTPSGRTRMPKRPDGWRCGLCKARITFERAA